MKDEVINIILNSLDELNQELEANIDVADGKDICLFGKNGVLDSLNLVNLIVSVEQEIEEIYGKSIILADEKAFSQRQSPFRSVETLALYIIDLIH